MRWSLIPGNQLINWNLELCFESKQAIHEGFLYEHKIKRESRVHLRFQSLDRVLQEEGTLKSIALVLKTSLWYFRVIYLKKCNIQIISRFNQENWMDFEIEMWTKDLLYTSVFFLNSLYNKMQWRPCDPFKKAII